MRESLNSPSEGDGAKLNLSAGMASAAGTNSCSRICDLVIEYGSDGWSRLRFVLILGCNDCGQQQGDNHQCDPFDLLHCVSLS